MTAVPSDMISMKLNNQKTRTMRCDGIVETGLVSGSYYNAAGFA